MMKENIRNLLIVAGGLIAFFTLSYLQILPNDIAIILFAFGAGILLSIFICFAVIVVIFQIGEAIAIVIQKIKGVREPRRKVLEFEDKIINPDTTGWLLFAAFICIIASIVGLASSGPAGFQATLILTVLGILAFSRRITAYALFNDSDM
jgi:preprotein translocase subunit SecY